MTKVGIKNLMKMIKKCISDEMEDTSDVLNAVLDHFVTNFGRIKEKTVDFLFEVCGMIDYYKGLISNEFNHLRIENGKLINLIEEIEKSHDNFDHGTVLWRKKY